MHSVTLHGVVWTLHHPNHSGQQQQHGSPAAAKGTKAAATSQRQERAQQRLQDFRKVQQFKLCCAFRQWKLQEHQQQPQHQQLPPPLPMAQAQALPLPEAIASPSQPQLQMQPRLEDEAGRASKRDAASSKSWATAPSTPPAKRSQTQPSGPPPPSIPPSPPSSHPSAPPSPPSYHPSPPPPPSHGEESSPELCSNQTSAANDQVGREGGASGDSAGCPPARNDTNYIIKSKLNPEKPAAPHSSKAGCRPGRVPIPRQCTSWCEEHVDRGWVVEELGFQCDQCFREGFGDDDFSDISVTRWKSTKMGFRCRACHHVLPWLHDEAVGLCHKCWKNSVPDENPEHKA